MANNKCGIIRDKFCNQSRIYFMFNGKIEGEYKQFHENGQLVHNCYYINNKTEGETKYYEIWGDRWMRDISRNGFLIYCV